SLSVARRGASEYLPFQALPQTGPIGLVGRGRRPARGAAGAGARAPARGSARPRREGGRGRASAGPGPGGPPALARTAVRRPGGGRGGPSGRGSSRERPPRSGTGAGRPPRPGRSRSARRRPPRGRRARPRAPRAPPGSWPPGRRGSNRVRHRHVPSPATLPGPLARPLLLVLALLLATAVNAAAASARAVDEPLQQQEWWLGHIGITGLTPPGPGVPVTIIDSGTDPTHPEFTGRPNTTFENDQSTFGREEYH